MLFFNRTYNFFLLILLTVAVFSSCRSTLPKGVPFVYENEVKIIDKNIRFDERKYLQGNLEGYWHDSISTNKVRKFVFFTEREKPPLLDTINVSYSMAYMNGYLQSLSFYNAELKDSVVIDSSHQNQHRAYVTMYVKTGKPTIIETFGNAFTNDTLQRLAQEHLKNTNIREGRSRLTRSNVSGELDRVVGVFRNNGYYFLRKNNLIAEVDTVDAALLQLTLDPVEQAIKMAEISARQNERPSASVFIKERRNEDSVPVTTTANDFRVYKVGRVNFFPDMGITDVPESVLQYKHNFRHIYTTPRRGNISIYQNLNKFRPRTMLEHLYLMPGDLYNDSMYFKTLNNLSSIGAWQSIDSRNVIRGDSVIDFNYFMIPALQHNVTVDVEASRNTGDYLFSSNLFGLALNLSFKNRNVWKRAIQATSHLRSGVELNLTNARAPGGLLQTVQLGAGQSLVFPRFVVPFGHIRAKNYNNVRTILNLNASYTDRREYFRLRSVTANWGYEWQHGTQAWLYRPINVEIYGLDTLRLLHTAFETNPFLTKAFNTGTVISQQVTWRYTFPNKLIRGTNFLRIGVEEAGGLVGLVPSWRDNIYRFVRLETEYIKHYNFRKTTLALRGFGGVGYNYNNQDKFGTTLPFFKQFIAGGPNSMRGWNLRQLGLGSSLQNDTSSVFRDRYGDMQLEANMEYRFPLFRIRSVQFNSAVFADIGNIWNVRKEAGLPNSEFNLSKLGKNLAIAMGTGLRMDFSYFLIRFDIGFKLKDPARIENNGWLNPFQFTWRNNEFPVRNNPLTGRAMYRNNYALQLGIGLPF